MEGGGAIKGRGSGVEYWRGETHLGSSLPESAHGFLCPHVVAHVCVLFPVSVRGFPCPHIVACVCALLPLSPCCCPSQHIIACVCMSLPASIYVREQLFSFVGMGGSLCSWVVVFVRGQRHIDYAADLVDDTSLPLPPQPVTKGKLGKVGPY